MMSLHSWHGGATEAGIVQDIYKRIPSGSMIGIFLNDLLIYPEGGGHARVFKGPFNRLRVYRELHEWASGGTVFLKGCRHWRGREGLQQLRGATSS